MLIKYICIFGTNKTAVFMTFYNKIKWVLGIIMVFVIIVATNLIDKNNFVRVKDSVVTIYEDRLVANDLIFNMSKDIQTKEIAAATSDSAFYSKENKLLTQNIDSYVTKFGQTRLTLKEKSTFDLLQNNLQKLKGAEKNYINSNYEKNDILMKELSKVHDNLYDLSQIQLIEGRRQMSISKKAIDTVELFTNIEIYLLIALAIVIQIVVMYQPKKN